MLDLVERTRVGAGCEVFYVFFDTGLEYIATKRHLTELEQKYGVEIVRRRAEKSIPLCVKQYGQPFLSKYVSQNMERLQRHGFQWEDEPLDVLSERYPRCLSALKWWTNSWTRTDEPGSFDIGRVTHLRDFIIENPPDFRISDKCCYYAKKLVGRSVNAELGIDVELVGVRKAEGGIRASSYKSCFDVASNDRMYDVYRPLFWFSNQDKAQYEGIFGVTHSDCYSVYGFARTGCSCCPFGRKLDLELSTIKEYEPNMYKAVTTVFADSYEYTRRFREFQRERRTGQMAFDLRHARC